MVLPETGSSSTPYDDVFRTLLNYTPNLIIPLINELFDTNYGTNEKIISLANELYLFTGKENRIKKITDSNIGIGGIRYHIECQSTPDGTMIVRMFQYDVNVAVQNAIFDEECLNVDFPHSAVIFLRCSKKTPNVMKIIIHTPGGSVTYDVEVLKIRDYTIEELFEKKLYFLIPFYAFNLEKQFEEINSDENKIKKLRKQYDEIILRLDSLAGTEQLTGLELTTLVEMIKNIMKHLTEKYDRIKKEVETMGGQVLQVGYKQAEEYGEVKLANLISKLVSAGRDADIVLAATDEEARKRLYKEFDIID